MSEVLSWNAVYFQQSIQKRGKERERRRREEEEREGKEERERQGGRRRKGGREGRVVLAPPLLSGQDVSVEATSAEKL